MSTPYIAQVSMFGGNFAPRTWAFCNGQLLPINQNQALFSLLGTTYGGNGQTTFALPNLQSQLAIHQGQGAGLSGYTIGQVGGFSTVTLTTQQIPGHPHSLNATAANASATDIGNTLLPAQPTAGQPSPEFYASQIQGQPQLIPKTLNNAVCGNTGGGQSHSNLMPSLCITFIIALQGIFPSRN
jgi:microcystin-dependent protein